VYLEIDSLNSKMEMKFYDQINKIFLGKVFFSMNEFYKAQEKEIEITDLQNIFGHLMIALSPEDDKAS